MKTLSCDFCEARIEGEDFDSWMKAATEHYGKNHGERLEGISEEDKAKWVAEAKVKFEATDNS